jgi:hypothetical protein
MATVILVEGTWGGGWAYPGSPLRKKLEARNFKCIRFQGWSTDVDGVPNFLGLEAGKHADWIAGGYAFGYQLASLPFEERNVICHSHGINPVLYQAKNSQVPIRNLVSVCSPVRGDMQETATAARPYIKHWRHISATDWDFMQRAGELFDGHWNWKQVRKWEQADENVQIPKIGHSKLLNDPAWVEEWDGLGNIDYLTQD